MEILLTMTKETYYKLIEKAVEDSFKHNNLVQLRNDILSANTQMLMDDFNELANEIEEEKHE